MRLESEETPKAFGNHSRWRGVRTWAVCAVWCEDFVRPLPLPLSRIGRQQPRGTQHPTVKAELRDAMYQIAIHQIAQHQEANA
jgi:hypothetical protein